MELFTLTISKNNYLDFLEYNSEQNFLRRLKGLCSVVPEFTYQPILHHKEGLWCYDNSHYWEDDIGLCSLRFQNSYFGFSDAVNNFECINIDCKSFEIKLISDAKIHKMAGVPINYISTAHQKLINEQERKSNIEDMERERARLIAEIKILEEDLE